MGAERRRILVVEDHADTTRLYERLLRADEFDVTTVQSLSAALELCAAQPFDLLISDINLADGQGDDLLVLARRHCPGLRGIVISGYSDPQRRERARQAGYAHYLTKPIIYEKLGGVIADVFNENG